MGLFGITPLTYTFSRTGLVDGLSVSVHGCQIYSLNSSPAVCASIPRGKTGILSCPQDRVNRKRSPHWNMTQVCLSRTPGLQGQVHPMFFSKESICFARLSSPYEGDGREEASVLLYFCSSIFSERARCRGVSDRKPL
jgi:hypothetical protein